MPVLIYCIFHKITIDKRQLVNEGFLFLPLRKMFLKGQAKYVPCALLHTPRYQSLAHGKNLQGQDITLTQLSLTLVSRVCQLCCNAICRLIKSASITPRWEKGGTRPKCCISNCHATSFAISKIATSEKKYLKSFHALIFHALHHCVSGITILCMIQFSPNKHIASPATHLYATSV